MDFCHEQNSRQQITGEFPPYNARIDEYFVLFGINSVVALLIKVMKLSTIVCLHVSQLQLIVSDA